MSHLYYVQYLFDLINLDDCGLYNMFHGLTNTLRIDNYLEIVNKSGDTIKINDFCYTRNLNV